MSDAGSAAAEGNANKKLIEALLRSRLFRDYESVFTKATGLPLTLRPLAGKRGPHGKSETATTFDAARMRSVCFEDLIAAPKRAHVRSTFGQFLTNSRPRALPSGTRDRVPFALGFPPERSALTSPTHAQ